MEYIQARRLAGMMTSKQRREIQMLAKAAAELPETRCERYDPITASCAQSCVVCSNYRNGCAGLR